MNGHFIAPNSLLIECVLTPSNGTTQQKNPFATQMQLQNKRIIAIEAYNPTDAAYSPISTGNPCIPQGIFPFAFLTLYTASLFNVPAPGQKAVLERGEGLWYDQLPLTSLRRNNNYYTGVFGGNQNSNTNSLFMMRPTEVSWTKSYVTIPNPQQLLQQVSALFTVYYLDEGDDGAWFMSMYKKAA